MHIRLRFHASTCTAKRFSGTRNDIGRALGRFVLRQVAVVDFFFAQIARYLAIRTLSLPMGFQGTLLHLLTACHAADGKVQTALLGVFPPHRQLASILGAFDHGVSTVYGDVVLHFSTLDFHGAALVSLGAFDEQIINDVNQDLARCRPRSELGWRPACRAVAFRSERIIRGHQRPCLSDAVSTEVVIALGQYDGVHEGASTDGAREVVVRSGNIVQEAQIHRRVEVLRARL